MVQVKIGYEMLPLLKYTDELIPVPHSVGFDYLTREIRVGCGSYKNLEISYLSYKLLRSRDSLRQMVSGRLLNEFNEEAVKAIQLQDTLAVQEL